MAEKIFYCLRKDWFPILTRLLDAHPLRFVIDRDYDQPTYAEYRRLTPKAKALINEKPSIYILGDFSTENLFMRSFENSSSRCSYFISPTRGGPAMRLLLSDSDQNDKYRRMGFSSFYYSPKYETLKDASKSAGVGMERPASKETKREFARMFKTICQCLHVVQVGKHRFFLSESARKYFNDGGLLQFRGTYLDFGGQVHRPPPDGLMFNPWAT